MYLNVAPEISQELMTGRYHGHESRKDIYEKDLGYLRGSREVAEYCCEKLDWKVIQCNVGESMRGIDEIQKEIRTLLYNYINSKNN